MGKRTKQTPLKKRGTDGKQTYKDTHTSYLMREFKFLNNYRSLNI